MATNFNNYKTTSNSLFPKTGGIPSWDLTSSWNAWDTIIDYIAILWSWFFRAEATAGITVTSSPFIYVAGTEAEVVYISDGSISAIEKMNSSSAWISILSAANATVYLLPGEQLRVTYSSAPTMTKDVVGMFVNSTGSISTLTPGSSPWTISNPNNRTITLYLSDGSVTSVTRNGVSLGSALPPSILLPPGGAVVITYTLAPTVVQDS